MFRCNLSPVFWQNDCDLLCATALTQEWNGHKVNSGEKYSPTTPARIQAATFRSQVWCSTDKLPWLQKKPKNIPTDYTVSLFPEIEESRKKADWHGHGKSLHWQNGNYHVQSKQTVIVKESAL